ncbi:MAG: hypothetical protein M1829_004099 [Trizodia sp. TS-e1964]|nr:MAG: hypothetical protein M1829_004099 [Trizodia sp. TS-e1964]
MSDIVSSNPPVLAESKSAKKKKAKVAIVSEPVSSVGTPTAEASFESPVQENTNGIEIYESPYVKELMKSIRNVNKKINATSKVDSILAENPGKTLDELIAARKINQDQKTQIQKKPSLQASLLQLEEQVAQYKKFDREYQTRLNSEKAALRQSHKEELEKVKEESFASGKTEAEELATKLEKENLLVLTKFLRAAAAKRSSDNPTSHENRAFEAVLVYVYGGDLTAVSTIEKLVQGIHEDIYDPAGDKLAFTYAEVKESALAHIPFPIEAVQEPADLVDDIPTESFATNEQETIVIAGQNAGLAETSNLPILDEAPHGEPNSIIPQADIDAGAANSAAESTWDVPMSASVEDWVNVPRDPTETETGLAAAPAANHAGQSWADDHPDAASPPQPARLQVVTMDFRKFPILEEEEAVEDFIVAVDSAETEAEIGAAEDVEDTVETEAAIGAAEDVADTVEIEAETGAAEAVSRTRKSGLWDLDRCL